MLVQSTFLWYSWIPQILSPQFNSLHFNFSFDHSDLIFILLNLGSIQSLTLNYFTSYFWCVIFRFRSRGGRMITSLNWILTHLESYLLGASGSHLMTSLITWGISSLGASCSPSFWHLCHLLHLLISWSKLITFLIWVKGTSIGTV